ncbi:50S ribosomal protein L2 [Candidatus Micrarchaeota archaeon]|nr:50S ribosomal protein L2 [Candidatus Micrarchaeota archaeon]
MGSKITVQKRGHGSPAYRTPKHRFLSKAKYPPIHKNLRAQVLTFEQDPSKDVLLAKLLLDDGRVVHVLAAEGLKTNDEVFMGPDAKLDIGSVVPLERIPDSSSVFNLEIAPKDGGRIARTSGSFATIVSHDEELGLVTVRLSSKQVLKLDPNCMATIGVASGGGRTEKPLKKAGTGRAKWKARNKRWPVVRGSAMNAVDHPHGGRSMGKPSTVSRNAPPGQKVGHIAASRTGRRKGKMKVGDNKAR